MPVEVWWGDADQLIPREWRPNSRRDPKSTLNIGTGGHFMAHLHYGPSSTRSRTSLRRRASRRSLGPAGHRSSIRDFLREIGGRGPHVERGYECVEAPRGIFTIDFTLVRSGRPQSCGTLELSPFGRGDEKAPGSRDLGALLVGITRGSRRSESSIGIVDRHRSRRHAEVANGPVEFRKLCGALGETRLTLQGFESVSSANWDTRASCGFLL